MDTDLQILKLRDLGGVILEHECLKILLSDAAPIVSHINHLTAILCQAHLKYAIFRQWVCCHTLHLAPHIMHLCAHAASFVLLLQWVKLCSMQHAPYSQRKLRQCRCCWDQQKHEQATPLQIYGACHLNIGGPCIQSILYKLFDSGSQVQNDLARADLMNISFADGLDGPWRHAWV